MPVLGRAVHYGRGALNLLRGAWTEFERDHARYLAGAMVYYALVSLVPLLLLVLSTLGLLLRFTEIAAAMREEVLQKVEGAFGAQLRVTVEHLLTSLQQDSIVATAVGMIGLLLTASVLFRHLRLSFRAIWKYAPPLVSGPVWVAVRASLREKVIGYVLVLMGGGLLLVALALIGLARGFSTLLERLPTVGPSSSWLITTLSSFTLAATVFALLFKFMPPRPVRWRDVWLAALLCAAAWDATGVLLSLYGTYLGSHLTAYGALGALLVAMLWMNLISKVLFFGAELSKVTATQAAGSYS